MPSKSVPSSSPPPPSRASSAITDSIRRPRSQSTCSHSRERQEPSTSSVDKYEFWAGNPSVHMTTGQLRKKLMEKVQNAANLIGLIYVDEFDFNTKAGRSSSSSSTAVDYDGFEPTVLLCPCVSKDTPPTEVVAVWESYQAGVEQYKVLHGPYPESYLLLVLVGGSDSHANARQLVGGASSSLPLLEVTACRIDAAVSKTVDDMLAPVQLFAPVLTKEHQCSICLDPLLATSTGGQAACGGGGVALTILCGHSFHWKCLSKWCDRSCPVCRFQQYPSRCSSCDVCGEADSMKLMVCLVCGFIGCCDNEGYSGFVEDGLSGAGGGGDDRHHYTHAYAHYLESDHAFAMQVSTQSVYDFSEGGFVGLTGRASQESGDDEASEDSKGSCKKVKHAAKKILQGDEEDIMTEFNEVYATLQESQQQHYEEIFEEIRARNRESYSVATGQRDEILSRLCDAKDELDVVDEERTQLKSEEEEVTSALEKLNLACDGLKEERRELDDVVAGLKKDIQRRKIASMVRAKKLHSEKADLREQMKDLKQYLSMRAQVEKSGATDADVQGSFVIAQNTNRRSRRNRR